MNIFLTAFLMNCDFGMYGASILKTQTQMLDASHVGSYTEFSFPGTSPKKLDNKILQPKEGDLFYFQLDEGQDDKNISITVKNKKNEDGSFQATAFNPQTQFGNKMDGNCLIIEQ